MFLPFLIDDFACAAQRYLVDDRVVKLRAVVVVIPTWRRRAEPERLAIRLGKAMVKVDDANQSSRVQLASGTLRGDSIETLARSCFVVQGLLRERRCVVGFGCR